MVNMDIETVLKKHQARLTGRANVTSVGIGEKDGRQVILVFVSSKVAEKALPPSEIVPKTLDGSAAKGAGDGSIAGGTGEGDRNSFF